MEQLIESALVCANNYTLGQMSSMCIGAYSSSMHTVEQYMKQKRKKIDLYFIRFLLLQCKTSYQ